MEDPLLPDDAHIHLCIGNNRWGCTPTGGSHGGIATGKSTVSTLLSNNNAASGIDEKAEFVIIDLDKIAHDILLPKELVQNDSVYDRLVSEFGTDILLSTNEGGNSNNCSIPTIDRRKLGDLVFADRQKRRKLNQTLQII